jgi:glutaredoxin 3
MVKDITIYTSNYCAYCGMVKQFLDLKGQTYKVVNIDEQPQRQNDIISLTGRNHVPVTVITKNDGSQNITVGYNITKLASALST